MRSRTRCIGIVTLALLGMVLSVSCGLKRNPPERRYFVLEAPRPDPQVSPEEGPLLYIRTFRVSPLFEQQSFVYHRKDGTWVSDFHNQLFVLPAHNITDQARKWLAGSGLFQHVTTVPGIVGEKHLLSASVEELYGDRHHGEPRAVLTIDCIVLGPGDPPTISLRKEYTEEVPIAQLSADALVEGWNQALARVLKRLEADLAKVDFSPPPEDG